MRMIFKFLILISVLLSSCTDKTDKKIIYYANGINSITIIKDGNKKYLMNGKYKSEEIPKSDFILNDSNLEYFSGLAKWTKKSLEVYCTYGNFENSNTSEKIKYNKISTKEFEKLKKDSLNYLYFYY